MGANVICISRAIWTGAEGIAADVAKALGFRYVDEEVIKLAAERRNLSPSVIADAERRKPFLTQFMADISRGGVAELINFIPGQRAMPTSSDDARVLIREAIMDIAEQGKVVIVAHAASYAVGKRKDVLRVLITGSAFERARRWTANSGGQSPREADETVRASDLARMNYLKRFYDVDAEAPEDYDLTVSTDKLSPSVATDLILRAAQALEPEQTVAALSQAGWSQGAGKAGAAPN